MAGNGIHAFEKDALSCAICTDTYIDPCTLCCGHTFCRKCVTKYTKKRLEAGKSNAIPCAFCDQVTVVPNPKKPVGEWAWQIKLGPVVQRLMEKQRCGTTHAKGREICSLCKEKGEITAATSWCTECEVPLCSRCAGRHLEEPSQNQHCVLEVSEQVKEKPGRNIMNNEIIEIKSALAEKKVKLDKEIFENLYTQEKEKSNIEEVQYTKTTTRAEMKSAIANAITLLRKKERELSKQIDDASDKQIAQHQENQINNQRYQQHCEFIDQVVQSESETDMYDMNQVWQSLEGIESENRKPSVVGELKFTPNLEPLTKALADMLKVDVTIVTEETPLPQRGNKGEPNTLPTPELHDAIDIRHSDDDELPGPMYVTVMNVDGIHTVVVSDFYNRSLKSIYVKNDRKEMSLLKIPGIPLCVTKMTDSRVAVNTEDCHIVIAEVQPELVLLTTLQTNKRYFNITALPDSRFAAVTYRFPAIDIIDMKGRIIRYLSRAKTERKVIQKPYALCTTHEGNILVGDWGSNSVYAVTSDGDIVFSSKLNGDDKLGQPYGIAVTNTGDILLTDSSERKIIQLTPKGKFIGDLLTRADGIVTPWGLCVDGTKNLYVCQRDDDREYLKVYNLS